MSDDKGRPRQLGRGLEALFGEDRTNLAAAETPGRAAAGLRTLAIGKLVPNPRQPRRHFDDEALGELAASIREKGILQPLIVRPAPDGGETFEIVAGERRWRAAQRAQVHEAPVIVREFTDEEALAVALIENIQRDELSPIEEAEAYARLGRDYGKTQAEVAAIVGKSRSHVANMTRLLELPDDVRGLLADGSLSAGHARALLRARDPADLARRIVAEGLSVREAERLGQEGRPPRSAKNGRSGGGQARSTGAAADQAARGKDADTLALERQLGSVLGLKVDVTFDGAGGRLTLEYRSLDQLDSLIDKLMGRAPARRPGPDYDPDDDLDPEDPFGDEGPPADRGSDRGSGGRTGGGFGASGPGGGNVRSFAPPGARPAPAAWPPRRPDPPWETAQEHPPDAPLRRGDARYPDRAEDEPPEEDY